MSTATESGEEPPRDPSAYCPSLHFANDVVPQERRHIDGEVIDTCIEEGKVLSQPDGRVYYRATLAGITYRLVASPAKREVITAYPIGINTEVALESGRWSSSDVEDVRQHISEESR